MPASLLLAPLANAVLRIAAVISYGSPFQGGFPPCPNARELSEFLPAAALSPLLGQDGLPVCDLPGGGELRAGIGLMEKLRSRRQAEQPVQPKKNP